MNKSFFFNLIFLVFINLLVKPFYIFGIDRTIQNTVGAADYGIYLALFNFTFLFQIINDFGIQNYNNRNIAQHNQLFEKYFPNILVLKLLLAGGFSIVVFLVAWITGYLKNYAFILPFFILNQILISLIFYLRSNISGLGHYKTDSLLSISDRLQMIIICGILLWWNPWGKTFQIEWLVYAQTFALSITTLIAFAICFSKLRFINYRFDKAFIWLILKKSYPYALMIFLMTACSRIDVVMIERLLPDGDYHAGVYGAAYRLLDAANMIGFLFAGLLLPMFSRLLKDDRAALPSLLRFSFQLIMAGVIPLALATYFYQNEIMMLLYDEANQYWAKVLGFLILSFITMCTSYIYGTLLTANDSVRSLNYIFVLGFFFNVILNYILLFKYNATGAAVATLATQTLMAIAQISLVRKELNIPFDINLITKLILYTCTILALIYAIQNHLNGIDWRLEYVGIGLISIVFAFFFRLLNFKFLLQEKA